MDENSLLCYWNHINSIMHLVNLLFNIHVKQYLRWDRLGNPNILHTSRFVPRLHFQSIQQTWQLFPWLCFRLLHRPHDLHRNCFPCNYLLGSLVSDSWSRSHLWRPYLFLLRYNENSLNILFRSLFLDKRHWHVCRSIPESIHSDWVNPQRRDSEYRPALLCLSHRMHSLLYRWLMLSI